jgi:hypothetical protein
MPAGVSDGEYRVEYDLAAEQKNAAEGGGTSAATASSVEFTTPEQVRILVRLTRTKFQ